MANDGSCNFNNGDNNDIESLPSTLEQLLIVHAQLYRTVQQILVQMQNINQLMQSMEARPSSRERVLPMMILARRRRSMQPKRQYSITTEVPRHVLNVQRLAILPIDAPKTKEIESATIVERRVTMLIDAPTLLVDASTDKPMKRRKNIEDGYDPYLDG
jgi:hypothetical protein